MYYQSNPASANKARRVLNKLPKNLIELENQKELQQFINTTFSTMKVQDNMQLQESYLGLEVPASAQLQRVNRKLTTWDRTQDLVEKSKLMQQ